MDYNITPIRENLIGIFGKPLEDDKQFVVNSSDTFSYNCIAWAMGMDDRWVDHQLIPWHWWPSGVQRNNSKQALIDAFAALGFEETTNPSYEQGYEKVALYAKGDEWSHAAKIIDSLKLHSKFGALNDAFHSGGDSLSIRYGYIYAYMRRDLSKSHLSVDLKGPNAGEIYIERIRFDGLPIVQYKGALHLYNGDPLIMRGSHLYTASGHKLVLIGQDLIEVNP